MPNYPLRRGNLIYPFGVGSLMTTSDGISVLAAGLDYWFKYNNDDEDSQHIDRTEFYLEEWRLERALHVSHFMEPPDYRQKNKNRNDSSPNMQLAIPFLRFPSWHFCGYCHYLDKVSPAAPGRLRCPVCKNQNKRRNFIQVPFVAMCTHGHLQDFPWREWVHHSINPTCAQNMSLTSAGGTTLGNQKVSCECGQSRSLKGILGIEQDGSTYLTNQLDSASDIKYLCKGISPQHGETDTISECQNALWGALRSASNLYYPKVVSSIYLPPVPGVVSEELLALLKGPSLQRLIKALYPSGANVAPSLREVYQKALNQYPDSQINKAAQIIINDTEPAESDNISLLNGVSDEFKLEEYKFLCSDRHNNELLIKSIDITQYNQNIQPFFQRIQLVKRLRETRVLTGFTRIYPDGKADKDNPFAQMWKSPPPPADFWLPAYKVYGEGVFLELNQAMLAKWERLENIAKRTEKMAGKYNSALKSRHLLPRSITPRLILLHTFAHLMINQMTFECGYSTSALHERLYASNITTETMAGILIYTTTGDSDGTLGGLVRMGNPGFLEPVISACIRNAAWCSSDPICMEIGDKWGQGPDSCNLAACHNCSMVPESACEEFNRFLDRAMLIGTFGEKEIGFFSPLK